MNTEPTKPKKEKSRSTLKARIHWYYIYTAYNTFSIYSRFGYRKRTKSKSCNRRN